MLIRFAENIFSEKIEAVSRNLSKWQTVGTDTKKVPNITVQNTTKRSLNNTETQKEESNG